MLSANAAAAEFPSLFLLWLEDKSIMLESSSGCEMRLFPIKGGPNRASYDEYFLISHSN
jgi:hypothetical protein